jgi:hypothetical protein
LLFVAFFEGVVFIVDLTVAKTMPILTKVATQVRVFAKKNLKKNSFRFYFDDNQHFMIFIIL